MTVLLYEDCINNDPMVPDCQGGVDYHAVPGGNAYPRCDKHWGMRMKSYEESDLERYADSDVPPAWFDPEACGERWNEED